MHKAASTALVRRMAAGLLSGPSITRAAGAMRPGQFRTVGNLGRGQFSLVDRVVGNVGGHTGEMARKLPTHALDSVEQSHGWLKPTTEKLNKMFGTAEAPRPFAPYVDVNAKGAFQHLGNEVVPPGVLQRLPTKITDMGRANRGPHGQVVDFSLQHGGHMVPRIEQARIDPGTTGITGRWLDVFGNARADGPHVGEFLQRQGGQANDRIRQFWAATPAIRETLMAKWQAGASQLRDTLKRLFSAADAKDWPQPK